MSIANELFQNQINLDRRSDGEEIRAWLGPAYYDLTDDQLGRFVQAWDDITARYGDDDQGEANAALTATVQYLLGEIDLDTAGQQIVGARARWQESVAAAAQVARMAAADGVTEAELARRIGVDRARTVRRWLGKG